MAATVTTVLVGVALVAVLAPVGLLLFAPARMVALGVALGRRGAGLARRELRLTDGPLVYLEGGEGEPVVLLHGFGADKDSWLPFARRLGRGFRVLALDLPGFGESPFRPELRYDMASQAARVAESLAALELGPVHLVGSSMGGYIAALVAARHPERVASLALFDASGVPAPEPTEVERQIAAGAQPLVVRDEDDFARLLAVSFARPPRLPRPLRRALTATMTARATENGRIWDDIVAHGAPLLPHLGNVRARTLVLWGREDRILSASVAPVMAAALAEAELAVLEGCGHAPMVECPAETAARYRAFLRDGAG